MDSALMATRAGRERRRAVRQLQVIERGERERGGLGPALTAAFMGLLMVRSLTASADQAMNAPGQPAVGPDGDAAPAASGADAGGAGAGSGTQAGMVMATGSVLEEGHLINPDALASLSGDLRFDAGFGGLQARAGGGAEAGAVSALGVTTAQLELPGGETVALAADAVGPVDDGENVGPIGDVVTGTDGDDVITGTDDDDHLDGGDGDDTINAGGGDDTVLGGNGDDTLNGQDGDDLVLGGNGEDAIDGGNGDDTLQGNAGDDAILGGSGQDTLDGGEGDDALDGGTGNDVVTGGSGNDGITIGGPGDIVFENPWGADQGGNDTLTVAADFGAKLKAAFPTLAQAGVATFTVGDSVEAALPEGANSFKQQVAPDIENVRLTGSEAHDIVGDGGVNVLEGNAGANMIWGRGGDDQIRGGAGDDQLFGGDGDDLVMGDEGDDWLHDQGGDDMLYGGAGDDTYVMGLNDVGVASIYDHEGGNRILMDGAATDGLAARMDGSDLTLSYQGSDVAILKGYGDSPTSFTGIDIGGGQTQSLTDLLAAQAPPAPDILAEFVAPGSGGATVAMIGGPVLLEAGQDGLGALDGATTSAEFYAGAEIWMGGEDHAAASAERGRAAHG